MKQNKQVNTLTERVLQSRYCASHINIESQLHSHEFYEFSICVEGEFENFYNLSSEQIMEKGTFFLARPGEIHKINKRHGGAFFRDDVYVPKKKMKKICNAFSDTFYDKIKEINEPIICALDYDKLKSISNTVNKLSNIGDHTDSSEEAYAFLIVELLNVVYKKYFGKTETSIPKWLLKIVKNISKPESFIIPLADLLENSFYSRSYISMTFKKYFGETIIEYRNRMKVNYSVSMLAENSMSINRIAGLLGWDNPNNYIIAFKKVYGVTPLQHKKSLLKN